MHVLIRSLEPRQTLNQSLLADFISGGSLGDTTNSSLANQSLEFSDGKLAKTGNSFQRPEDWSQTSKEAINKQNTKDFRVRRNSFMNSNIRAVTEVKSGSYSKQRQLKCQKFVPIQQKIESSFDQCMEPSASGQKMSRKLSLDANASLFKPRYRTASIGKQSILADFMPGGSLGDTTASSMASQSLDLSDEKLAKTGNSFRRREDWSIITKLPVNKQNTIDIRLEDEGPYGNDETRCFVLSHFSLLGVHELSCVFCGCELVVYDR